MKLRRTKKGKIKKLSSEQRKAVWGMPATNAGCGWYCGRDEMDKGADPRLQEDKTQWG